MIFTHLTSVSNTCKISFYGRTIPEWTSFPAEVTDQASVEAFSASLFFFYSYSVLVKFIPDLFFLFYFSGDGQVSLQITNVDEHILEGLFIYQLI